jgi:hypothetical protein
MFKPSLCAGALALALAFSIQGQAQPITNGVIVISTRTASDALFHRISSSTLYDADDFKGPGMACPGDTAMATLLQDHGYLTRLIPEWLLRPDAIDPSGVAPDPTPDNYYNGGGGPTLNQSNALYSASLVIISGSGSSADMPPPNTNGIPIIMGEHSCLGDQVLSGNSSLYMYGNKTSGNQTATTTGPNQYMLVVATNHPIMQGIPLDSQGRVKIWRDPYPEENAHLPPASTSPKPNYKYSWTYVDIGEGKSVLAPATLVLGVMADVTNRAVFAVNPAGGELYSANGPGNGETNHGNYVHFFVNEHGSGDARRAFNALTDLGKEIFIRTCKWAMGESLQPYKAIGLIEVSQVNATQIRLSWQGSADKNYKVLATTNLQGPADFSNWQTIVQDIPGTNGIISRKLDISKGPQYAFLRIAPMP